jgi:hypothetical protein
MISLILANDQLDAQIFNTFITILYMYKFRAIFCSSSGGQFVQIQHLVSSLSVSDRPVHRLRKMHGQRNIKFWSPSVWSTRAEKCMKSITKHSSLLIVICAVIWIKYCLLYVQLFGLNIVYSNSRFMSLTQKVFTNVSGRGGISQRFSSLLFLWQQRTFKTLKKLV